MASSLSDDEFHRMQIQLIELRTENYTVNDTCKKQTRTITDLTEKVGNLDRELQKAQKTIQKSKKAKDVESLLQDNEILQRKLLAQEEEFSLQNTTLMQELSTLVARNEELERLVNNGASKTAVETNNDHVEMARLRAESTALQKKMAAEKKRFDDELTRVRDKVRVLEQVNADLEAQCDKLAGKRGTPAGDEDSDVRTVEGVSDSESRAEDEVDADQSKLCNSSFTDLMTMVNESENNSQKLHEQLRELDDLKLKFDTVQEENRLLREQFSSSEKASSDQVEVLQGDVHKLTEKLRKKQESLLQLQEEKENMYSELSKRLDDLQTAKESEVASLMEQNQRMQREIVQANEETEDYREKTGKRVAELEQQNNALNEQVGLASAEGTQQLRDQNQRFQRQIQDMDGNLAKSLQEVEDIGAQLKEAQQAHRVTLQELQDARAERDKQIQALQEMNKVAEKRKTLLDDLAIKYQVESDDHRETIKMMEEKHKQTVLQLQAEVDKYQSQIDDLEKNRGKILHKEHEKQQVLSEQFESLKTKYENCRSQISSLEEAKGWLERRLAEMEETVRSNKNEYENDVFALKQEHTQDLVKISDHHSNEMKNLRDEIARLEHVKASLDTKLEKHKQAIKDSADEIRLRDKKAMGMMKDLKRQLHAERKRNDRLQEKLQELFADNKNKLGVDDLFRPIEGSDRMKGDNSSISSWSMSGVGKESSMATSISLPSPKSEGSPCETPPSVLEQDNNDLLNRLTEVQEKNWQLEERVSILEASNSAMAEDLLRKRAIIDHYVMDSRISTSNMSPTSEKLSLRRMIDIVKDKGEDSQREMNKKLQNMLEETLTKNMHLQKDLELLSEEVVRMSKGSGDTN